MQFQLPWLSRILHRQPQLLLHAAVTVALIAALFTLTLWAASAAVENLSRSDRELARHARQRALVASLQESLIEARRVESAMLRQGAERAAGYKRWDAAVASARRTLGSLNMHAGLGEKTIVQEAQQQLESYSSLLDRAWMPPGTAGAPVNPAPLVARAGDHMMGVLQTTVHLGAMARSRAEVSQEALRTLMGSLRSIGTTFAWWLLGVVLIVSALATVGLRPLIRGLNDARIRQQDTVFRPSTL